MESIKHAKTTSTASFALTVVLLAMALFIAGTPSLVFAEPVTIRFEWNEAPQFVAIMEKIIDDFHRLHPDIRVDLGITPEWREQLAVKVAAGAAPDVVILFSGDVQPYAIQNTLMDLNPYLEDGLTDNMHPAHLALVTHENAIIGMPLTLTTLGLVYNADVVQAAGLGELPTDPEQALSWDAFRDVTQRIRGYLASAKDDPEIVGASIGGGDFWRLPWIYSAGGALLDETGTKSAVNSEETYEALTWLQDMFQSGYVNGTAFPHMANGMSGMAVQGHWDLGRLWDEYPTLNLGVTYMPQSKVPGVGIGGDFVAVVNSTKYPEEAATFVKYLTSPEVTAFYGAQRYYLTTWRGVLPDFDPNMMDLMQVFLQQTLMASEKLVVDRGHAKYPAVRDVFLPEMDAVLMGHKDPQAALEAMETGINAALSR